METVKICCRCKDCEYFEQVSNNVFFYCYRLLYEQGSEPNEVDSDDFCSYGKAKQCVKK